MGLGEVAALLPVAPHREAEPDRHAPSSGAAVARSRTDRMLSWSRSSRPSHVRWSLAAELRGGRLGERHECRRVPPLDLGALVALGRASRRRTRGSCRAWRNRGSPSTSSARTRLWSARAMSPSRTSMPSSPAGPQTASAVSRSQPPTKTDSRHSSRRSPGDRAGRSSRRWLRAASAAAPAGRASPTPGRRAGRSRRPRIASGGRSLTRAAASSIASGMPWSRAQIPATAGAFSFVTRKSGRTATRALDEEADRLVLGRWSRRRPHDRPPPG